MHRRIQATIVGVVGAAFIATVLGTHLFATARAFDRVSPDLAPAMRPAAIAQLRSDVRGLQAVSAEFGQKVLPTLAQALHVSEAQLAARLASTAPAIARGALALPAISARLDAQVTLLQSQLRNFERADAIPTKGTSSSGVPWFILITGIAAILAALVMLRPSAVAAWAAFVVGVIMISFPVATQLPGKAAAADRLDAAVQRSFTQATVAENQQALQTIQAMGTEMQTVFLPGLASQLNLTPAQAQGFAAREFPAITAATASLPESLARFGAINAALRNHVADYADIRGTPNRAINWTVVAGGIVVMLTALWALATIEVAAAEAHERAARKHVRAA